MESAPASAYWHVKNAPLFLRPDSTDHSKKIRAVVTWSSSGGNTAVLTANRASSDAATSLCNTSRAGVSSAAASISRLSGHMPGNGEHVHMPNPPKIDGQRKGANTYHIAKVAEALRSRTKGWRTVRCTSVNAGEEMVAVRFCAQERRVNLAFG